MAAPPQISVIATVLNERESIGELVSSLLHQTIPDVEIVIVDGGSTDGTWERLQELASEEPRFRAIRDESCNLKASPGPIARGRNRAIAESSANVIACADAGCKYDSEWLANLTRPILRNEADYVLGGSFLDPMNATAWDIAASPFLGMTLRSDGVARGCTARSMALRKYLWERVGGFPELNLAGEDTLFDMRVREIAKPISVAGAMARYQPNFSFMSAAARLGWYAAADGTLGIRRARLMRNLLRCAAQLGAIAALAWTVIPAIVVASLELYFAFAREARSVFSRRVFALLPSRLIFSLISPSVITYQYLRGGITKANRPNLQNVRTPDGK